MRIFQTHVWRKQIARLLSDGTLWELEPYCLTEILRVLSNLRLDLVQCDVPRTNNDKEPPLLAASNSCAFVFATNEGFLFLTLEQHRAATLSSSFSL